MQRGVDRKHTAHEWAPPALHPQFAHAREARGHNRFAVPIWKCRAELFQKVDISVNAILLRLIQGLVTSRQLIGVFDFPRPIVSRPENQPPDPL